jgi:hypothetical protein
MLARPARAGLFETFDAASDNNRAPEEWEAGVSNHDKLEWLTLHDWNQGFRAGAARAPAWRAAGMIGDWSPGIGDPTVIGWLTVLAYLIAAGLCFRVFRATRGGRSVGALGSTLALVLPWPSHRRRLEAIPVETRMASLWLGLAVLLLLLGINKQLDLQTAFTEIGRIVAHRYDWYDKRRNVQVIFIIGVVLVGLWASPGCACCSARERRAGRPDPTFGPGEPPRDRSGRSWRGPCCWCVSCPSGPHRSTTLTRSSGCGWNTSR